MPAPSTFTDSIRSLIQSLQEQPRAPIWLNRAAGQADRLGRRLHGFGWVRDGEIGGCLAQAVGALSLARECPEADRAEPVQLAIRQLEAALDHTAAGTRAPQP